MRFFPFLVLILLVQCTSKEKNDVELARKIDKEGIKKTISKNSKTISECYSKSLMVKGNENLKGRLLLEFVIDPEGKANNPKRLSEKSSIESPELESCMIAALQTWQFPIPPESKPITVRYPFIFRADPPKNMQQKMDKFRSLRKNSPPAESPTETP